MSSEFTVKDLMDLLKSTFEQSASSISPVIPQVGQAFNAAVGRLWAESDKVARDLAIRFPDRDGPKARQLREMSRLISLANDVRKVRDSTWSPLNVSSEDYMNIIDALSPRHYPEIDFRLLGLRLAKHGSGCLRRLGYHKELSQDNGNGYLRDYGRYSSHYVYTGDHKRQTTKVDSPKTTDVGFDSPFVGGFTFRDVQDNGCVVKTDLQPHGVIHTRILHDALENASYQGYPRHFNHEKFLEQLDTAVQEEFGDAYRDAGPTGTREGFLQEVRDLMRDFPPPRHVHQEADFSYHSYYRYRSVVQDSARCVFSAEYALEEGKTSTDLAAEGAKLSWVMRFATDASEREFICILGVDDNITVIKNAGYEFVVCDEEEFVSRDSTEDQPVLHITSTGWGSLTKRLREMWSVWVKDQIQHYCPAPEPEVVDTVTQPGN